MTDETMTAGRPAANRTAFERRHHDADHDANPSSENPIEQLNPMTKIAAVFSLGLGTLVWPDPWLGVAVIVGLFSVSFVARMQGSFTKLMFGFGIPITVMLMFIQGLYSPRNVTFIADLGFARLGLEGVMYAAKVIVTVLVFLGSFTIMTKTTYTGRLVAALAEVGMPAKAGYLVLASLNVVPQMQRRMAVIQEAQSARGLRTGGGLIDRVKATVPLLGPVVLSSLTDAQERGMTLETRGFGVRGIRQTSIVRVEWRRVDAVLTWTFGVLFVAIVAVSICVYAGVLPLPGMIVGGAA